ncbi:hypothetical protein PLICRDRAFT_115548 [Plicaturopsis crispa FD-325 SS-3]|nr:hypothetical protein PLICRDRAFT_115548 [Plicaturopsis crispa FD-325 SS-3]
MTPPNRLHAISTQPLASPEPRPFPPHRHSCPSGPWPWVNITDDHEQDPEQSPSAAAGDCPHVGAPCAGPKCWAKYPQSLFPNWTPSQVLRSGLHDFIVDKKDPSAIHAVNVRENGRFETMKCQTVTDQDKEKFWAEEQQTRFRLRALFVENLSGPVLQMLGTKYFIEPFFFSSSLNWIPSRYQEDLKPGVSDHITVTLTFLATIPVPTLLCKNQTLLIVGNKGDQVINTQAHLPLVGNSVDPVARILFLDLLAIHMVRRLDNSIIISYHPVSAKNAKLLHTKVRAAGESIFWQNIFQGTRDPTFVLLTILWYALYAWDEALEMLYKHICWLESCVISTADKQNDIKLTQELHVIRAHLLHYESLLTDFAKSVTFVRDTPNPAMDSLSVDEQTRTISRKRLERECNNLSSEIARLQASRGMQGKRLKNAMDLAFSSINFADSQQMQRLTKSAVRDSAAMKQIAYLTMIFLPASFIASAFGMNIKELESDGALGTLAQYLSTAIPLTTFTMWIIVAFQGTDNVTKEDDRPRRPIINRLKRIGRRLCWPLRWVADFLDIRVAVQRPRSPFSV